MHPMRQVLRHGVVTLAVLAVVASACSSSSKNSSTGTSGGSTASTGSGSGAGNTASAPGVTPTTIKIGFLTSFTGNASSTFSTADIGAKAYFNAINQAGGINGRKIELVTKDDASSPSGALTATQLLLSQGVYGIVADSAYFFGAYREAQAQGVPVTGSGFDGPEWGQQPNTNMFSTTGGVNPNHPTLGAALGSTALAKFLGAKNVGGLAYGTSLTSTASIKDMKTGLESIGLHMGYENLSVVFGTTDVSSPVLAMKQAGVDLAACACVQSTVLAMVTGLKQAGVTANSLSQANADSTVFANPTAAEAAQGLYGPALIPPLDTNNSASKTFADRIKAVDPSYQVGSYPSFGITQGYVASALMVKGLQMAGQNPTRQSFITKLTQVSGWDADGILPAPGSFSHFGSPQNTYCNYYVKVEGRQFVSINGGKPICLDVPPSLKS
jgi:branched-chain amino acid transport system substrate-binding protein